MPQRITIADALKVFLGNREVSPNWTQTFDSLNQTGIGSFTLDPGAIPGSSDSGVILVLYASYVGGPNVCPFTRRRPASSMSRSR
jgi:hypothetical protein